MTIRTVPWRHRVPTLLLAAGLHALFILVFLRGLTLNGHALFEIPLLVSIVTPPPTPSSLPPVLRAPQLAEETIPVLIAPAVSLPSIITVPVSHPAPAPKIPVRAPVRAASSGNLGNSPPQITYTPPDADSYCPVSARRNSAQGHVWTRVCVYSTGKIASIVVLLSSGDPVLDRAALTVAHLTRWKPAIAHGKPVARCSPFRVDFALGAPRPFN